MLIFCLFFGEKFQSLGTYRVEETGKRHKYAEARYALGMVDTLLECGLLNDGKLPDMQEAQEAFARLFDAVCTKTLEFFTEKQTEN